ncbi:histidine kinase [Flavisolibacter sp. BT320]|nr:histidine kinase [Flavisolibacter longurius]
MNISTLLLKRRFSYGRVFWVSTGIYLFFTVVGLVAMYISPAMNTGPNWEKIFSTYNLISQVASILFFSVFYYVTLNLFYRFFAGKDKPIKFVKPAVIGYLLLAAYYSVSFYFMKASKFQFSVGNRPTEDEMTMGIMIFSYLLSSLFIIGSSLLIAYLTYLRDERKHRKVLEEQKMQLEVEKSQANLNFLKAQINPHFLHNTLNFLYAKSLPYSAELSEGILTLSDIMRYALGPAAKDGRVALKDEIEHVRNVIKINQLRFSNNLHVRFDVNGVVNGATIVPFVLITIVENAFKHGDLKNTQTPIDIRLDMREGQMHFFCRNHKKAGPKEISTGIGLDNIKKQLDLTYGRNYSLNVRDEAEFYTTELIIKAYDQLPDSR